MIFCIVGFALGATIESKTKGIWIWVQEHPQFPDRYLVLLDTEGLGDAKKVSLLLLLLLPLHLFILFLLLLPAAQFPDTEQAYIPIDKIIRTSKQSASTS